MNLSSVGVQAPQTYDCNLVLNPNISFIINLAEILLNEIYWDKVYLSK